MALRTRTTKELSGPPMAEWGETTRVFLPGGGVMYVPVTFTPATNLKERLPKHVWRSEADEASIAIELISYHRAMLLDRARFGRTMAESIAQKGGTEIGDLETLTVSGFETFYGRYCLTSDAEPAVVQCRAYARILTRNSGLLFEAEHPDMDRLDRLAKAVLATLVF